VLGVRGVVLTALGETRGDVQYRSRDKVQGRRTRPGRFRDLLLHEMLGGENVLVRIW
jgi:hypothetical protein